MFADVLVLNRNFYAVHVTSWQRALSLLYADHAAVVDEEYRTYSFEDWKQLSQIVKDNPAGYIHTPTLTLAIPDVIALKIYDKLPVTEVKFTRRNIYEFYGYKCCYCGNKFATAELNLDHVVPKSRGGQTGWNNIVTACVPCNLRKANKTPAEAGMQLLIKPSRPKWRGNIPLVFRSPLKMRSSWQRFIDTLYWNGELEQDR